MNFQETLLIVFSLTSCLGIPCYLYFRNSMVKDQGTKNVGYSGRRVLKLTAINLAINFGGATFLLLLFADIFFRVSSISSAVVLNASLFLGMLALAFYGSGIYITSIVLEAFTLPQLRQSTKFKTQFIATHLFHGPISHIFIFSGYQVALFILALMDIAFTLTPVTVPVFVLAAGFVSGILFAVAQIYNGTAPYQFITGVILLILFGVIVGTRLSFLHLPPISTYFLSAATSFISFTMIYFGSLGLKGKRIDWGKSGR